MSKIAGWSLTEEINLSKCLHLDLETEFAAAVSEILKNHSKSFLNQNCRKRHKAQRQPPGSVL